MVKLTNIDHGLLHFLFLCCYCTVLACAEAKLVYDGALHHQGLHTWHTKQEVSTSYKILLTLHQGSFHLTNEEQEAQGTKGYSL